MLSFGFGPASACRSLSGVCSTQAGEGKSIGLLGLTCSDRLRRWRGIAHTVGVCEACLLQLQPGMPELGGCLGVHGPASQPPDRHVLSYSPQVVPKRRGGSGEFVLPVLRDFPLRSLGAAFLRVKRRGPAAVCVIGAEASWPQS